MPVPTPEQRRAIEAIFRRRSLQAEQEQRLAGARALIKGNDRDPNAYIAAARCCKQLGRLHETLDILHTGIARCLPNSALYEYYIERLEKCNRTEEAIAVANAAARLFPGEVIFKLREALLLPVLYDTPEQVDYYRRRYTEGLHKVISQVPISSLPERQRALVAVGKNSNKYLGYQGRNDRELQVLYGGWVHRILAANYPDWVQPRPMPVPGSDGKLRVGYISARFRDMSVTKMFLGWLREGRQEGIAAFAYHAGAQTDAVTDQVRSASESFQQLPSLLEDAAQAILADNIHILVFLDLGMDPWLTELAGLRLAATQCMAWDYPVTSGLPSIDYCFTGTLMEPEGAQAHYSETLFPLPGIGVSYTKPSIPVALLEKSRKDFNLREDAVVYLSPQSIFKYLPGQDILFAQIARRVPRSQFLFLLTNEIVRADFEKRLERAFASLGLRAADYCVLEREVTRLDYWNLHKLSDVVLDTIGWSGGVSTFESIACGVPVVTLPGSFMRGRQSGAILTQLGVTETIARDRTEYVDIAVQLGIDSKVRQAIIARMEEGSPNLYSDTLPVRELAEFYRRVVADKLRL